MLFDSGIAIGAALVKHPLIRAVAFTGSLRGGRALMDLAAARPDPIPCFTEMSSGNPVFILPGALRKGPAALAQSLFGSFTLGAGQFCTKPGIVFVPDSPESTSFLDELKQLVEQAQPFTMLTEGIVREYDRATSIAFAKGSAGRGVSARRHGSRARTSISRRLEALHRLPRPAPRPSPNSPTKSSAPTLCSSHCDSSRDYLRAARALDGHLTATILGDEDDLAANRELIQILEQKAGRLIFNGFPTGVEVTHAMVHGGPYPSTSDPRFTSVGSLAIYRFARPVCFQNFPQAMLPPELQDENPLGISRLRDGKPENVARSKENTKKLVSTVLSRPVLTGQRTLHIHALGLLSAFALVQPSCGLLLFWHSYGGAIRSRLDSRIDGNGGIVLISNRCSSHLCSPMFGRRATKSPATVRQPTDGFMVSLRLG